jgi:hypothetical protein
MAEPAAIPAAPQRPDDRACERCEHYVPNSHAQRLWCERKRAYVTAQSWCADDWRERSGERA